MSIRNMIFSLVAILCLVVFTNEPQARAAPSPLALSGVLQDLSSSPRILKSESALEESSWQRVGSYSGFLPTVSVGAQRVFDKQYLLTDIQFPGSPTTTSIPQIIPTTTYSLTANWLIFDGFANVERFESAKAFEGSAKADADWTKFQAEREVILLYYQALASKVLRQVAEQNAKALEDHLSEAKLFKRAGITTNFDLLRVEVQLSESQSEVLNSKDSETVSLLRLGDLTNVDYSAREISGELPILEPTLVAGVQLGTRKDIESLEKHVEGLEEAADAEGKHWLPKVSLFAQLQRYNNRTDALVNNDDFRDARTVGVQLSWPLFDGFADVARTGVAKEREHQSEYSLMQARTKMRTDLEYWKRKFIYYTTVYRSRSSDVAKSTESVRLAREGRKVGARTSTELLDAESELFRSRAGLVNSQIGAIEALVGLELASGRQLYKFQ
jgi:outer membrane protein TolC